MALNIKDKKSLINQVLPEIEFAIAKNGITVFAKERFTEPRFIPFDCVGKCRECKATEVELDFVVTNQGLNIFCTRIRGSRFIAFDTVRELPGHCFFRLRNRGRVFNIPHNEEKQVCNDESEEEHGRKKQKIEKFMAELTELHAVFDQGQRPIEGAWSYLEKQYQSAKEDLHCLPPYYKFFVEERYEELKRRADAQILMSSPNTLQALLDQTATTTEAAVAPPAEPNMQKALPTQPAQAMNAPSDSLPDFAELDAFFDSLNAATVGIPNQANKLEQLKEKANEMEIEESAAIASITQN